MEAAGVEPFAVALERHGLALVRGETTTLQVNTGYLCNLRCRHCHLEAGPGRAEIMSRETMAAVVSFARRFRFGAIDITGGAPEMVPDLPHLVEGLAPLAPRLMLRTNLSAVGGAARESLLGLCVAHRVVLVASLPSTSMARADAQRGAGVTEAGISVLRELNAAGYGLEGTGLELDLVVNPVGATMQVEGCVTMGLGYVFREEVRFKGGQLQDDNFDTYEIPRFSWLPQIETVLVPNPELPAQGCGEPAIITMGAVVANAIYDAAGCRLLQMPMTPARVLAALKAV